MWKKILHKIKMFFRYSRKIKLGGGFTLLQLCYVFFCYKRHKKIKDRLIEVKLKGNRYPIFIRTNSSDVCLIFSISLAGEYDLKYPMNMMDKVTIIDAGANIGLFSIEMANKFPESSILAVEPDLENYKLLEKNTKGYPNIICINKGLWSEECWLKVHTELPAYGITVEKVDKQNADIEAIDVNYLIQKYNLSTIDIMKMDIEGSEYQIFTNNNQMWISMVRMFIIESHEYLFPGCRKQIDRVLTTNYNFELFEHGEDTIYIAPKRIEGWSEHMKKNLSEGGIC